MKNTIQTKDRQHEEMLIRDTYNDEHWQNKYGVSSDELKSTADIGIPAKIIKAHNGNKVLQS